MLSSREWSFCFYKLSGKLYLEIKTLLELKQVYDNTNEVPRNINISGCISLVPEVIHCSCLPFSFRYETNRNDSTANELDQMEKLLLTCRILCILTTC